MCSLAQAGLFSFGEFHGASHGAPIPFLHSLHGLCEGVVVDCFVCTLDMLLLVIGGDKTKMSLLPPC